MPQRKVCEERDRCRAGREVSLLLLQSLVCRGLHPHSSWPPVPLCCCSSGPPCPGPGLLAQGHLLRAPLRLCTLKRSCRCLATVRRGRSSLHVGTSLTGLLCAPRSPCSHKRGAHGRYWGPGSLCPSSQLPGAGALAALLLVGPISWLFQVRGCPPFPRNSTSQNVCRGHSRAAWGLHK